MYDKLIEIQLKTAFFISSYVSQTIIYFQQEVLFSMLDFAAQKKLLDPILKHPRNHHCADCDTISPTWASLDFGVFLCSNCSGAHRALGPTITRVRSANLDKWQEEWVGNMILGNEELNKYWQSDPNATKSKPKMGATLNEIGRYVFEKYVKKRYVKDPKAVDPLTSYKNGTFEISKNETPAQVQPQPSQAPAIKAQVAQQPEVKNSKPKPEVSLLDFDFDMTHSPQPVVQQQQQAVRQGQPMQTIQPVQHDEDEFTDYTQPGSVAREEINGERVISFDALMNQHKQAPQQQQQQPNFHSYQGIKSQNIALHHPYNPHIAQHNLVYNSHFPPQQHIPQQYHGQMHAYSANPGYQVNHNFSPMGHGYPNINHNYGYPPQQYSMGFNNQVGVGSYWK